MNIARVVYEAWCKECGFEVPFETAVASPSHESDRLLRPALEVADQLKPMSAVVEAAKAVAESSEPHYITFADEEPEWIETVNADALNELESALDELDAATAPPDGDLP